MHPSDPKPTIVILAAMHLRPHISELFCMAARRLAAAASELYTVKIVAFVSDEPSLTVCQRYGVDVIHTCVGPLGKKMNLGFTELLQNYTFDYILRMGDDDIVSDTLLHVYHPYIQAGLHYFGLNQLYFLDSATHKAVQFQYPYQQAQKLVGCGTMISRHALERTGYRCLILSTSQQSFLGVNLTPGQTYLLPSYQASYLVDMNFATLLSGPFFQMYPDHQMKSMDYILEMAFLFNGYDAKVVHTDTPLITDVKSNTNIWKFNQWNWCSMPVDPEQAMSFWSEEEKQHYHTHILLHN